MESSKQSHDRLIKKAELQNNFLPVSDPTLWRMEQRGELTPVRIGKTRYWRLSDVLDLIVNGK